VRNRQLKRVEPVMSSLSDLLVGSVVAIFGYDARFGESYDAEAPVQRSSQGLEFRPSSGVVYLKLPRERRGARSTRSLVPRGRTG
jgi:hypothetical protein